MEKIIDTEIKKWFGCDDTNKEEITTDYFTLVELMRRAYKIGEIENAKK